MKRHPIKILYLLIGSTEFAKRGCAFQNNKNGYNFNFLSSVLKLYFKKRDKFGNKDLNKSKWDKISVLI